MLEHMKEILDKNFDTSGVTKTLRLAWCKRNRSGSHHKEESESSYLEDDEENEEDEEELKEGIFNNYWKIKMKMAAEYHCSFCLILICPWKSELLRKE